MKTIRLAVVLGLTALAATVPGTPGLAGTEALPEVTDIAGDANLVNGNGVGPDVNQGTAPASIDSLDLRAIWLETAYTKTIETVGEVRWVRYEPTGLVVKIKTTAPPKPTVGPSVIYRFPALLGGSCSVYFEVWLRGSAPGAVDREYVAINRLSGCSGAVTTGFPLSVSGSVITATFPFAQTAGTVTDEMTVGPSSRAHVRAVLGSGATYCCTVPAIDEMPLGSEFEIGSDVPADVNCSEEPAHPDCA